MSSAPPDVGSVGGIAQGFQEEPLCLPQHTLSSAPNKRCSPCALRTDLFSSPAGHSRADLEVHSLPLRVEAQLMLGETSFVKGYMGVILLLPQEVLEVTQRCLWVLDGLRRGKERAEC